MFVIQALSAGARAGLQASLGFKIGHAHIRDVCIIFLTRVLLKWFRPEAEEEEEEEES